MSRPRSTHHGHQCLNESPSEKEGKWRMRWMCLIFRGASMKVPPKRKGNAEENRAMELKIKASMKVPPKRKGNRVRGSPDPVDGASMKVPPKRKGNAKAGPLSIGPGDASMKVPPKRKGNFGAPLSYAPELACLNESPSEKEGKSLSRNDCKIAFLASMKVPPKRKGNFVSQTRGALIHFRLNESPSEKEGT